MKTDIQIAQEASMEPIQKVAAALGIEEKSRRVENPSATC